MDLQDKSENHLLSCPHCPFQIEENELLAFTRHLSRHLCRVEIVCSLCNHVCSDFGDVQTHVESHFPFPSNNSGPSSLSSQSESLDSCTAVVEEMKPVASLHLDQHQNQNQQPKETPGGNHKTVRQYKCQFCTFQTEEISERNDHEKHHHHHSNNLMTNKPRQLIPCPFEKCQYKAKFLSQLKNHMRTHTKERPFACPHCDHTCNHKSNLQRHIWIHQRETMLLAQF